MRNTLIAQFAIAGSVPFSETPKTRRDSPGFGRWFPAFGHHDRDSNAPERTHPAM
jgi:hypothetical protein